MASLRKGLPISRQSQCVEASCKHFEVVKTNPSVREREIAQLSQLCAKTILDFPRLVAVETYTKTSWTSIVHDTIAAHQRMSLTLE